MKIDKSNLLRYNASMNDVLVRLGLNENEAECYRILVQYGSMTASELATRLKATRTNTYMILGQLKSRGLVNEDDSQPVRRYESADPQALRHVVTAKQRELQDTQAQLRQLLPELQSLYNLSRLKPGVVYLEGLNGLEVMLDDMARSDSEVLLIPGSKIEGEAWEVLTRGIAKRAERGVKTRAIFPKASRSEIDASLHKKQKFEVRYWGNAEYPGEIVVYGNKCVFTAYEPQLINTILTNEAVATTLRGVFENLWQEATT